jgi:hypothetical protein
MRWRYSTCILAHTSFSSPATRSASAKRTRTFFHVVGCALADVLILVSRLKGVSGHINEAEIKRTR